MLELDPEMAAFFEIHGGLNLFEERIDEALNHKIEDKMLDLFENYFQVEPESLGAEESKFNI